MWKCKCDCGNIKTVSRGHLTHGHTKSCGCLEQKQQEAFKTINLTHGLTGTKAYKTWCFIKNRCYNKKDQNYQHYGEKGIRLAYEWEYDPQSFCDYVMGLDGYDDPKKSLDRIDGTKGYCKGNLRWSTTIEQQNNKCNNHYVTVDGIRKSVTRWAEENGIDHRTAYARIKLGWSEESAVTVPTRKWHKNKRKLKETTEDAIDAN